MQVWFPEEKRLDQSKWFLWVRIIGGSVAAITAALKASKNFNHTSDWIESLALASFFLFWRTRQPGESPWAYLTNARAILTILSALAVVASVVWYFLHHSQ
jgi:hypothetical protein